MYVQFGVERAACCLQYIVIMSTWELVSESVLILIKLTDILTEFG